MRLSWFRVDPDSNVWCSSKRMEGFETWGRPCEDRNRFLSYAATSKAHYGLPSSHQNLGERHAQVFPHSLQPRGTNPANTLSLDSCSLEVCENDSVALCH